MRPGIIGHDDRVIVDSAAWPWQAIGRLNRGGSFCTATLIAPAAVLTARHCVWDPRTGQMVAPTELHFLCRLSSWRVRGARYRGADRNPRRRCTAELSLRG
ncbi:trypsin-like serine protease [Defluviicoccus vanus]|uniref:Trypsin-like serine protease n=1 Tax=Defluviicoccus vanus TaxID=111831 RepID=A0A7H1MZN7_9PROT|nr:trypsin-like serine protease [Defluviicoccus vanus]